MIKIATLSGETVYSGNRIYIMARNSIVARCQSLTGEQDFGADYVREIGAYKPVEIIYTQLSGTVTLNRYRMVDTSWASGDSALVKLGIDILDLSVLDINVMDSITKSLVVSYRGCSANTHTDTFTLNQPTTEELQMYYLYATDSDSADYSDSAI